MIDHKWNLQLFADGGGDGGAAPGGNGGAPGGEASNPAAPSASGVQEPPLRPAQERQMRRSGQLKKSNATPPASTPAAPAAEPAQKGQAEGNPAGEQPGKEMSSADHSDYLKFLSDHPQETTQLLKEMSDRISANMAKSNQRYTPLMKALAEKYGTDPDDVDGIMEALKGPVPKTMRTINALAMENGEPAWRYARKDGRAPDPEPAAACAPSSAAHSWPSSSGRRSRCGRFRPTGPGRPRA